MLRPVSWVGGPDLPVQYSAGRRADLATSQAVQAETEATSQAVRAETEATSQAVRAETEATSQLLKDEYQALQVSGLCVIPVLPSVLLILVHLYVRIYLYEHLDPPSKCV